MLWGLLLRIRSWYLLAAVALSMEVATTWDTQFCRACRLLRFRLVSRLGETTVLPRKLSGNEFRIEKVILSLCSLPGQVYHWAALLNLPWIFFTTFITAPRLSRWHIYSVLELIAL